MVNVTISVDEDVLRRARIKALQEGTSVNAYLKAKLEDYVEDWRQKQIDAMNAFLEIAKNAKASSGPQGRTWRRDDLYDR